MFVSRGGGVGGYQYHSFPKLSEQICEFYGKKFHFGIIFVENCMKMRILDWAGVHVPRTPKIQQGSLKFPNVFHRLVVDARFFSLKFVLWLLGIHYFLNSVFSDTKTWHHSTIHGSKNRWQRRALADPGDARDARPLSVQLLSF